MRKAAIIGALIMGAVAVAPGRKGADAAPAAPKKEHFLCRLAIAEPKDGGGRTLVEPQLIVQPGQLTEFLSGGQVPVNVGAADEQLSFGTQARLRVHRLAADKLRVDLYAGHSELEANDPADIRVREAGTRVVRDVTPGVPFTVAFSSDRRLTATVFPVEEAK